MDSLLRACSPAFCSPEAANRRIEVVKALRAMREAIAAECGGGLVVLSGQTGVIDGDGNGALGSCLASHDDTRCSYDFVKVGAPNAWRKNYLRKAREVCRHWLFISRSLPANNLSESKGEPANVSFTSWHVPLPAVWADFPWHTLPRAFFCPTELSLRRDTVLPQCPSALNSVTPRAAVGLHHRS